MKRSAHTPPLATASAPAGTTAGGPDRRRALLQGALGLGLGGLLPTQGVRAAGTLTVGRPAPPLVLHTLDGSRIASRDLHGQVVILAFWATWCEPCCAELPLLSAYAERHAGEGLRILGFSLDDAEDLAKVRQMAAPLSFPVGLLGSAWAGDYGRIWRLPVSFVIDRAGRLADNGWSDPEPAWTRDRLERVVTPLLGSAPPASPGPAGRSGSDSPNRT